MTRASRDKLDRANAIARANCPEILFCLASAARDSDRLPPFLVALRLEEARTAAERVLVAILAAEQSLAPAQPASAANGAPSYDTLVDAVAGEMGRTG